MIHVRPQTFFNETAGIEMAEGEKSNPHDEQRGKKIQNKKDKTQWPSIMALHGAPQTCATLNVLNVPMISEKLWQ